MIKIHFDFTDGTEVSYQQGVELKDNFTTCCLNFFCFDYNTEVVVKYKNGKTISLIGVLNGYHCKKQIRTSHNVYKMLLAGAFEPK